MVRAFVRTYLGSFSVAIARDAGQQCNFTRRQCSRYVQCKLSGLLSLLEAVGHGLIIEDN